MRIDPAAIQYFKMEVFIPESHFERLRKALQSVDAGHIGRSTRTRNR
ncbi:MAG: hypothetical protein IJH75_05530 [Mogibacterium sp.]|nr:hypothetical protein [Mogibacterium sp.]